MTESEILEIFLNSKTKGEFIRNLNIDVSHKNGIAVDYEILHYTSKFGFCTRESISAKAFKERFKEKEYKEYELNPRLCPECGKIIPFEKRFNKFCSRSCATAYTNKNNGNLSDSRKKNISNGMKKKLQSGTYTPCNQYSTSNYVYKYIGIDLQTLVDNGLISNIHNYPIKNKFINKQKLVEQVCSVCHKPYYGYITKCGNLSRSYCSEECAKYIMKSKISDKAKERIQNGTFSGWTSRNITSYPEQFWMNVLTNNSIDYVREFNLDHKYFLDFYIKKNQIYIDLEIDGKQHKYPDRIIHDQERDEYIKAKNILVYRIDWNEINSNKGKELMKTKIDNFLIWYKDI